MHPFLDLGRIDLPGFGPLELRLPVYGLFLAAALLIGWLWTARRAGRAGLDQEAVGSAILAAVLAGIVGGKLGLALVDLDEYLEDPAQLVSIDFLRAAGVVWTAVLGGLVGFVWAARRRKLPLGTLVDAAAIPLPVAQAIGRLGCLFAGCCYGDHCEAPWGLVYHSAEAARRTGVPLDVPLHPAPLYETIWAIAVVVPALFLVQRHQRARGELAAAYLALYAIGRFAIEFFRGDPGRGLWFGGAISTSQLLSALVAPAAVGAWLALRGRADARGTR